MISFLVGLIQKVMKSYTLSKYNDFTIEKYFRQQGARVGFNNRLEIRNLGAEPYLVSIGNHCTIAPNVKFITHDGGVWVMTEEIYDIQKFGRINVLDNCFIGIDTIILPNITIGPNSIVGAGSVVTKDVPENMVYAGNPAKAISSIDEYKEKAKEIWSKQKPSGYFTSIDKKVDFTACHIQKLKESNLEILKKHLINTI